MQQRGSCPMVAAQRLGEEYELKVDKAQRTLTALTRDRNGADQRTRADVLGLDNTARSEWANLVTSRKSEQAQLARYAFNNHWWDLSVQATIAGKLWDHLEERFPLAYKDLFTRYTVGRYSAKL